MKTLLICHQEEILNRDALARWLASFSELAGLLILEERPARKRKRLRREIKRVGPFRILDVLAYRLYYRAFMAADDSSWEQDLLDRLRERFPPLPSQTPILVASSANTVEAQAFIRSQAPDIVVARCKHLLKKSVFEIPTRGTFVMHPGICPEYRNAHGCFWALVRDDLDNVGMTLLRIDPGVDTGPVYGYYRYRHDGRETSHIRIQHRVVFDHLDAIAAKLDEIGRGEATSIDTAGRRSGEWGQPWLSKYLSWKGRLRSRSKA